MGNKANWGISKRVFQKNKARQIFGKKNISDPMISTNICFEICPFCLITDAYEYPRRYNLKSRTVFENNLEKKRRRRTSN